MYLSRYNNNFENTLVSRKKRVKRCVLHIAAYLRRIENAIAHHLRMLSCSLKKWVSHSCILVSRNLISRTMDIPPRHKKFYLIYSYPCRNHMLSASTGNWRGTDPAPKSGFHVSIVAQQYRSSIKKVVLMELLRYPNRYCIFVPKRYRAGIGKRNATWHLRISLSRSRDLCRNS